MSGFAGALAGGITYEVSFTTATDSFGDAIRFGYVAGVIGTAIDDDLTSTLSVIELFQLDNEVSNGSPEDDGPGVNLSITGFTADPGQNWLKSLRRTGISGNVVTGPAADIYQYTSGTGTAAWFWQDGDIGITSGVQNDFAIGV